MASSATMKVRSPDLRPQYEWPHQFSLAQFKVTIEPTAEKIRKCTAVTYRITAPLQELVPGHTQCDFMDFTITSPQTGTTILFEYATTAYDGGLVYRPAYKMNHNVPNIDILRRTLRVCLLA